MEIGRGPGVVAWGFMLGFFDQVSVLAVLGIPSPNLVVSRKGYDYEL